MNAAVETASISALPPHILQSHIFNLLDGASLASVACVSRSWRSISSENSLWEIICRSQWPSLATPTAGDSVHSFSRSLFSDCATVSCPPLIKAETPRDPNNTPELLISAVDICCDDVALYSNSFKTETSFDSFSNSRFELNLLGPNEKVSTPLKFHGDDEEQCMEEAMQRLRITWILINPWTKRAFNVCGRKPVEVHRDSLNGFIQLRYATVVAGPNNGESSQCRVLMTCGGKNGGVMEVMEANMQVEDLNGKTLAGAESLMIIEEAMAGPRRQVSVEKERYRVLVQKRIEGRRPVEDTMGSFDCSAVMAMAAGVFILIGALLAGGRWLT